MASDGQVSLMENIVSWDRVLSTCKDRGERGRVRGEGGREGERGEGGREGGRGEGGREGGRERCVRESVCYNVHV